MPTLTATPPAVHRFPSRAIFGAAVGLAVVVGAFSAVMGPMVAIAVIGIILFVAVAARPALGVYLYACAVPLIAGMERDAFVPLVRPHEALHGFLLAAVAMGWCVRYARGESTRLHLTRLDVALIVMALLGSTWPLASALAREVPMGQSDFMGTITLWRQLAVYVLFRVSLRTATQVRLCLWMVLLGGATLGAVALMQSLGLFGVEAMLSHWYVTPLNPFSGRGTATLSNSIAVGDYLAYCLALLIVWYDRRPDARRILLPVGVLLLGGLVGTGQFSAWIAALVVAVTVAYQERRVARLLRRGMPLLVLAVVIGWPVVAKRVMEFWTRGLPLSWVVRFDNLRTFYFPELSGWGWLVGVRPETLLVPPETWRDEIFLESGHLALLWIGGMPLLLAFFWFLSTGLRQTRRVALARRDDVGTAAIAAWSSLWVLAVLTLFDIHLTLRGGADLLFILLGIASTPLVTDAEAEGRQP